MSKLLQGKTTKRRRTWASSKVKVAVVLFAAADAALFLIDRLFNRQQIWLPVLLLNKDAGKHAKHAKNTAKNEKSIFLFSWQSCVVCVNNCVSLFSDNRNRAKNIEHILSDSSAQKHGHFNLSSELFLQQQTTISPSLADFPFYSTLFPYCSQLYFTIQFLNSSKPLLFWFA